MSSDHSKRLIVGVDGSHLSNAAVRWAARSAQLRGLDLHLVHALAGDMPLLGFGARDDLDPIRRQAGPPSRPPRPKRTLWTLTSP